MKVTTYEEATRDTFAEAGRPVCDLRIYPAGTGHPSPAKRFHAIHACVLHNCCAEAGVQYSNLPIEKVSQVTSVHVLHDAATSEDNQSEQQTASLKLDEALLQLQQPIHGVQLLVCCHGSRDTRCGTIGNELVTVLDDLIHKRQLQDKVEVLKCSHVGGHKVKPNLQLSVYHRAGITSTSFCKGCCDIVQLPAVCRQCAGVWTCEPL